MARWAWARTASSVKPARPWGGLPKLSASLREESRGSHYREDFPETSAEGLFNTIVWRAADGSVVSRKRPVAFTRRRPEDLAGDTVIPTDKAKPPVTHSTEI